jgi:hypothetical protein
MAVGPTLLPIFQQLGIYDDLLAIGKHFTHVYNYKEDGQEARESKMVDFRPVEDL